MILLLSSLLLILILILIVLLADSSKPLTKFYHMSGLALAGLAPLSFILSPSIVNFPIDLALGNTSINQVIL